MSDTYRYKVIKEHRCPVCGRKFYIMHKGHSSWLWKHEKGRKWVYECSFSCYMENSREPMMQSAGGQ